mmetsp:Transcript_10738/g.16295  ORF Transcript_10738/g.16295 Transcript_10738/m.16295 type:complete len:232 (-) Transcript_10738:762-1457(-)
MIRPIRLPKRRFGTNDPHGIGRPRTRTVRGVYVTRKMSSGISWNSTESLDSRWRMTPSSPVREREASSEYELSPQLYCTYFRSPPPAESIRWCPSSSDSGTCLQCVYSRDSEENTAAVIAATIAASTTFAYQGFNHGVRCRNRCIHIEAFVYNPPTTPHTMAVRRKPTISVYVYMTPSYSSFSSPSNIMMEEKENPPEPRVDRTMVSVMNAETATATNICAPTVICALISQ